MNSEPNMSVESPAVTAGDTMAEEAQRIGLEVAEHWAHDVDRDARFPSEAVAAMKASGLLGAHVPTELGGAGVTVGELSRAVSALAAHCASSALVFAMHQIHVSMLCRHAATSEQRAVLRRIVDEQLLLANANSEVGVGGDARTSICALEPTPTGYRLDKEALAVSYGVHADGITATARRGPEAPPGDQVYLVCLKPDYELVPTGTWDTLGLRGTCSGSFRLRAEGPQSLVYEDHADMAARTGLAVGNILLSSVWLGIAEAAGRKAHAFVRQAAKRQVGSTPPSAVRLAELAVVLNELRELLAGAARAYEEVKDGPGVTSVAFINRMSWLKVGSSSLLVDIVNRASLVCGLEGYRNDSQFTMGRLLRDAQGAPLMVNNDRVLRSTADLLIGRKQL